MDNGKTKLKRVDQSRRSFIKTTGVAGAGLLAAPFIASGSWRGTSPGDMINHAIIGTGRQGAGFHCNGFAKAKGCKVVAICDVDPERLDIAAKALPHAQQVKRYSDFRKLFEDKSIDSVSIVTPDQWHTPMALWALMAGKHVYIEKPCSHTVEEAELLVKAAAQYNKCVQHGTQRRSTGDHIEAMKQLKNGIIGKVHTLKAINHQLREPIGRAAAEQPPRGVNYDMWLGPSPVVPFTKNRWHYNWHWFWDYGGGDTVNDGVHQIDVAVWALGNRYPQRMIVSGGQFFYNDDHETPDTQTAILQYEDSQIIYEMRLWTPYNLEGHDNGNVAYGTDGKMDFGRSGIIVTRGKEQIKIASQEPVENIIPNFLTAVRENDSSKLLSPVKTGRVSSDLCNLMNIATRLNAPSIEYDPVKREVVCPGYQQEATALLGREYRRGYELPYK